MLAFELFDEEKDSFLGETDQCVHWFHKLVGRKHFGILKVRLREDIESREKLGQQIIQGIIIEWYGLDRGDHKGHVLEEDKPLTSSSRISEHYISLYGFIIIRRCKHCTALLWRRIKMEEFTLVDFTKNSHSSSFSRLI
jgi:hypothetical protein